jgi:hypothetical protein
LLFAGVSTVLELALLMLMPSGWTGARQVAPGPFGIVFALFVQYFRDIPHSSRVTIAGVPFSDKALTYLIGLQLAFASGSSSALAAAAGLMTGVLYRVIPAFSRFRPPACLSRLCARVFAPIVSAAPPGAVYAPLPQNANANAAAAMPGDVLAAGGVGAVMGGPGEGGAGAAAAAAVGGFEPVPAAVRLSMCLTRQFISCPPVRALLTGQMLLAVRCALCPALYSPMWLCRVRPQSLS